jgi:zinc transport system permease protein
MLELIKYQFFTHAIMAAFFSSITCGFIGTYIVTRRIVFISGGISHASFGGVGISHFLGINPLLGAGVFSVLSALGIEKFSRTSELRKDSVIGITWSFGMAVGIIFIFLTPGYSANLMSYLFGSILTVSTTELIIMALLACIVLFFFAILFKEILFVAFDAEYARTQGIPIYMINYLLMSLVALTIVINIRVVGIILVISLLTIPQATSNLISKNFKHIIFLSMGFGFFSSLMGLLVSYYINIPSGASIIFIAIFVFLILKTIIFLRIKIRKFKQRV